MHPLHTLRVDFSMINRFPDHGPTASTARENCGPPPCSRSSCSHTMTLTSANDFASIFKDGKLKPGIYMIQNVVSQTYVDMREHSRELCCRPDTRLEGKGLVGSCPHLTHNRIHGHLQWEILPSGPGYTIRRVRIEPSFTLSCTERGDVARTGQP